MTYDNTNRFSLFKNDRKQDERDPDYTGTLNVDGQEFFVDAWRPKTPGGKLVLSGRVKPKGQPRREPEREFGRQSGFDMPRRPNGEPAPQPASSRFDDEIPW